MRRLILTLVAVSALAGCASTEQIALEDDATCTGWGAAAGSSDYAACRTALTQKRAADAALFSERLAAAGRAMSAAGGSPQVAAPVMSFAAPTAPTITCFSRGERQSGMNKICFYDCLGSGHAVTQSAVSLCPLTVSR